MKNSLAFLFICFWGLFATSAWAQDEENHLDQIDFYLHTVDIGNLVYNNFGHTAIRVRDNMNGNDRVYNWGIFDVDDPIPFAINFYKGNLFYRLGTYSFASAMRGYKAEGRTVWEDKLMLSLEEKRILWDRLKWNNKPENRSYAYQYFFDNCSTRPRDYINEAIGGALMATNKDALISKTFREEVLEGYAYNPGFDALLDLGMNSNIDRFMTRWESMFHPLHLRDGLIEYSKTKRFLIGESKTLVQFERPQSYPNLAHAFFLLVGGLPLAFLGIMIFVQQKKGAVSRGVYRLFALWSVPWAGAAALFGFLMALNWLASKHGDLHHNANMLLFWPTDVFVLIVLLGILLKGRALNLSPRLYTVAQGYFVLHLLGSLLLPTLRMFGLIQQNVDRVSVYLLPPYLVVIFLLFRAGIKRRET